MRFVLLDEVGAVRNGQSLDLGPPKQRLVLAALLADGRRVVPAARLIDRVWGAAPPPGVSSTLYSYLARLRSVLGDGAVLSRAGGGYRLSVPAGAVDLWRWERLLRQAREADGPVRAQLFDQALKLWSGRPLADLEGGWVDELRAHLERQRLDALAEWAQLRLAAGDAAEVARTLAQSVQEQPLAEGLVAGYLQALHQAGRTAEALECYARTRDRTVEDLGVEPGALLRGIYLELLRSDEMAEPGRPPHVPRQLPAPPQMFTGRAGELADLDKIHDASTVVISAVDGMAGVGKTALAVQAAHQMVDRYPDGQLFIDLHGYTQGMAPVEPGEALDRMLRSLGIPGERMPADIDERAGLYRSRLADRRMVIVLDNAATESQVTPLLPGAPGCAVLITSRRRLAGLDHTHTLSLDSLPPFDAVTLLRQTAGKGLLAQQSPELVAELVELCGRLPLAIRIAAARLRSHPAWDLAHLVQKLRDHQHRLVELAAGQRSVTAALDLSYLHLSAGQQRTYRLLGLHPGADIEPYAAAALLDSTLLEAGRMLEQLLEAHLLQEPMPGRYRFHDLTRVHAADTATRHETEAGRRMALNRLLDHYLHATAVAMDAAYPYERERRPRVSPARTPTAALSAPAPALGWLDSELPNLLAAAGY
ncbi:MAG: winged helix-turn-helix domain-containing protein, partial [Actinobacteria bacterium]|nr:winged helix-turn-helix domain-containing protein [Actinomycetota bacterium]